MSVVEPGAAGSGLVARVKSILLQPKPTWEVIDGEPSTISSIYKSYVIPLAAIPAGSLVPETPRLARALLSARRDVDRPRRQLRAVLRARHRG